MSDEWRRHEPDGLLKDGAPVCCKIKLSDDAAAAAALQVAAARTAARRRAWKLEHERVVFHVEQSNFGVSLVVRVGRSNLEGDRGRWRQGRWKRRRRRRRRRRWRQHGGWRRRRRDLRQRHVDHDATQDYQKADQGAQQETEAASPERDVALCLPRVGMLLELRQSASVRARRPTAQQVFTADVVHAPATARVPDAS